MSVSTHISSSFKAWIPDPFKLPLTAMSPATFPSQPRNAPPMANCAPWPKVTPGSVMGAGSPPLTIARSAPEWSRQNPSWSGTCRSGGPPGARQTALTAMWPAALKSGSPRTRKVFPTGRSGTWITEPVEECQWSRRVGPDADRVGEEHVVDAGAARAADERGVAAGDERRRAREWRREAHEFDTGLGARGVVILARTSVMLPATGSFQMPSALPSNMLPLLIPGPSSLAWKSMLPSASISGGKSSPTPGKPPNSLKTTPGSAPGAWSPVTAMRRNSMVAAPALAAVRIRSKAESESRRKARADVGPENRRSEPSQILPGLGTGGRCQAESTLR